MTGTLIISLDCEGKWGLVDSLQAPRNAAIKDDSLRTTYVYLLDLLDELELTATFAFVGLFAGGDDWLLKSQADLLESPAHGPWIKQALEHRARPGGDQGWNGQGLVDLVRRKGAHELGSHSFSHLPLNAYGADADAAQLEFSLMRQSSSDVGMASETFIFPRNQVSHLDQLSQFGVTGYRELREARHPKAPRISNILEEVTMFPQGQAHPSPAALVPIPSGHMLNWPRGVRRSIPQPVTRTRWRRLIKDACRHDTVAHLWLHPHNLITAPAERRLLKAVLADAATAVRSGALRVETQASYVERFQISCGEGEPSQHG